VTINIRAENKQHDWLNENKTAIHLKIERAFGQFESGEFFSPGQSRADMEQRKSEWLRRHQG